MSDEGFRVDSPEKAAYVMRKYRKLAQRMAQHERMAEQEKERISAWLDRVNAPIAGRLEFYEAHLTAWALQERAQGRKSVEFPDGAIKTRQSAATFEVDKSTFVAWAEEAKRDDLLRTSLSPDMAAIKTAVVPDGTKAIDPLTGEVVPGLVPVQESVTVRLEPDLYAIDLEGDEDDDVEE